MGRKVSGTVTLAQVPYAPPGGYRLDLEVMTIDELLRRADRRQLCAPHRLDFISMIVVTAGHCRHMVDFVPYACHARSWLMVRPGQVHRYDFSSRWRGWQCVFRPEFLLPRRRDQALPEAGYANLNAMATHVSLDVAAHRATLTCLQQMVADAGIAESPGLRHSLLRHQLYTMLLRFMVATQLDAKLPGFAAPENVARFRRFHDAVEVDFAKTHTVADFARRIGCSEKTLTRAVAAVAGVTPKAYLSGRIVLEAKRLLAHTDAPIASIAAEIGFAEPTNFVKFFRREVAMAPGRFRRDSRQN